MLDGVEHIVILMGGNPLADRLASPLRPIAQALGLTSRLGTFSGSQATPSPADVGVATDTGLRPAVS